VIAAARQSTSRHMLDRVGFMETSRGSGPRELPTRGLEATLQGPEDLRDRPSRIPDLAQRDADLGRLGGPLEQVLFEARVDMIEVSVRGAGPDQSP